MDIHQYDLQHESAVEGIKKADISARNKELIMKFHGDLVLENLSKSRLVSYLQRLKLLARWMGKDFDKATDEEI